MLHQCVRKILGELLPAAARVLQQNDAKMSIILAIVLIGFLEAGKSATSKKKVLKLIYFRLTHFQAARSI